MIIGHDSQQKDISKILKSRNLNKSFIFVGKEGIGKKIIALEMAKYILDESIPDGESITFQKKSKHAQMVDNQTHPDLILINPTGENISIEDYNHSITNIYKKPLLSNWKVMIVNGAEKMNKNIFNSMLKLFEEPPHQTAIILITSNVSIIPATLLSRCVKINFLPLSEKEIIQIAPSINTTKISPELAAFAVKFADGSVKLYKEIIKLDIYNLYLEFLKIFSMPESSKSLAKSIFLKLYDSHNLKENWFVFKRLLIRILEILLEKSINIQNTTLIKEEIDFLDKIHLPDIQKKLKKIIYILNYVDTFQLDLKMVGLFCVENIN